MIGFTDNWLYDVGQKSNSNPIFVSHGLIAFAWFSLLVLQTGLISKNRINLHKKFGIGGIIIFFLLFVSNVIILVVKLSATGQIDPDSTASFVLFALATVLIIIGFKHRKVNPESHKLYMLFGSFLMMRPAIDRVFNKVTDLVPFILMSILYAITYLLFFYLFYRYRGKLEWYMTLGLVLWLSGAIYVNLI